MSKQELVVKLFEVVRQIYTNRQDCHPEVAAQFYVEGFMARHKNDKYFEQVITEEIEGCSRAL